MDNEELQVEEVDDDSSSFDVDTFLRYENTLAHFSTFPGEMDFLSDLIVELDVNC
jgi:hypothetical protein